MIEVDARGLSCPLPVIRVKDAIEKNPTEEVKVLIDTEETKENVTRMAENKGRKVEDKGMEGQDIVLVLKPA